MEGRREHPEQEKDIESFENAKTGERQRNTESPKDQSKALNH